ncbi:MAG: hypothetical protein KAI55_01970, partial [Candidatus Aenigmarchaeota archaeon]|nr:hypothetical protein [Candidatus Aenigmarchaeota archaeon]
HIPPENISEFEERITEEEKAVIQIATKICSALQNKNSIIDWMIAKGRVYISNIRKLELSDDQMRGKQINAVAKNSTFFEENNILVDKKFKKNLLFLYPKAEAIVLEQEGLLSAAGELAREMKKKYMDSLVCISNNINIAKIDNKDILIENEEISFPSNSMDDAITDNFFNIENLSKTQSGNKNETCETEKQTAQMNFFSKIIIKIPFNLDEDGIAYLNKKVDRYNNIFLLEKSSVGENSQHNYFFNYSNYYSNTINAGEEQEQSTPFKKLKINQLFIDKDDEATKINQMLGENLEINHYVEFNNLKEIILFDFSNTSIPQHIFLNIKNILGELETENLSNQNIEKVAELIKKFSLKAKKSNKKIITGIVFNENGNCILKKNLFYSDYLLVENNMLEEFEKIHESIKKYEQTFMFEYIKNQCLKKEL